MCWCLLASGVRHERQAEFLAMAPAKRVAVLGTIGGHLGSPHLFASGRLEELVGQNGDLKPRHIVGRRDQSAARNFVTGVQNARVFDGSGLVLVVPARAVGNSRPGCNAGYLRGDRAAREW
jgi:hypothetical protein